MIIQYFAGYEVDNLKKQLLAFDKDEKTKGIMILACDANNYTPTELDPILRSLKKPIFGGIFPAIIYNNKKLDRGFILAVFDISLTINVFENISSIETDLEHEIMEISSEYLNIKTMFVFLDGFAERIGVFIESIFTILGLEFNYIGGGAGSLSLKQRPCLITNQGLKQDCVIITGVEMESGIGVKHGWETISGPYKVTSAEKTVIKELDFRPAFEVYKEVVEKHSGASISKDNFFEIAKAYPFGINKIDTEKIVRDPLLVGENNSLICVGEVETGSFVDILTGDKNSLIQAAGEALKIATENKKGSLENFIFFVDCISRVLFLEDDFTLELEEIHSKYNKLPLFGVTSIGEIANNGKDYLEFYNKTSVIGCF
jgi:hypothetical protein